MSEDQEFDFESAFGAPQEAEAPRLSVGLNEENRKIVQPQERLAAWLGRGYGLLAFPTLLLMVMTAKNGYVLLPALAFWGLFLFLLTPLLGKRPSATPLRLVGVATLLSVGSVLTLGVLEWATDLGTSKYDYLWLYRLALSCQQNIERATGPWSVLSVMLSSLVLFVLGKWLLKKYPWVDTRLRVGGFRRALSLALLSLIGAALVVPPLYVEWRVSGLEWVKNAQGQPLELRTEPTDSGVNFTEFARADAPRLYQHGELEKLSDGDFLARLESVNTRLADPGYGVTQEDYYFLYTLFRRCLRLESPSPTALRFLLLVQQLLRKNDLFLNTVDFSPALLAQSQLLTELDSLEELEQWKQLADANPVPEQTQEHLDRVALSLTELVGPPASYLRPIKLLGIPFGPSLPEDEADYRSRVLCLDVPCGPSLAGALANLEKKVLLLDYSARRHNQLLKGEHPFRRIHRSEPITLWQKERIQDYYSALYRFTEEKVAGQDPRLIQALISLRRHKLEHGVYPETFPAELEDRYSYTSLGNQAVVEAQAKKGSIRYGKWVLR